VVVIVVVLKILIHFAQCIEALWRPRLAPRTFCSGIRKIGLIFHRRAESCRQKHLLDPLFHTWANRDAVSTASRRTVSEKLL
jgi:hypothetical protein